LQGLQKRYEVQKIDICWIVDPALDWYRIIYMMGSLVSVMKGRLPARDPTLRTFMKDVTHRRVINYHYFREIWLHGTDIFDIGTSSLRAMLAVIASLEVFPILF
jgi:hypothetical protein